MLLILSFSYFDPLCIKIGIQTGDTSRNDIRQYSVITEFSNPSDELLQEWVIYCGSVSGIIEEHISLDLYWVGMQRIYRFYQMLR